MERALVGVDGSPAALHALSWTAALCQEAGSKYVAARVFSPTQAELSPDVDKDLHAQQREELAEWCRGLPGAEPSEQVLIEGDAAEGILGAAVGQHADLIVVGAREFRGLTGPPFASVAHQLLHTTTLPLAVVPPTAGVGIGYIVVGVDGSPSGMAAVRVAADLARRLHAGVTAVYNADPLFELVPDSDPRSWKHDAERNVRRWVEPIEQAGVSVDVDIDRDDDRVAAIARAVESHPSSVTCLGLRALSAVTGRRVGHIALELLHRRDGAVILVPADSNA